MIISYQYRLKPNYEQCCRLNSWLEKLRCQYNYLLADRFDWWENNRSYVNSCPLICSLAEPREKPEYYKQKRSLVQLKQDRPWYKDIHAHVLQDMVKRVDLAFSRYIKGDKNGKCSGKPRFKGKNRYRTIGFPSIKSDCVNSNRITFPKLGDIKFIQHRPLPDGFTIKRALVTKKADGWYVTLTLEDKADATPRRLTAQGNAHQASVPNFSVDIQPTEENSLGIDSGLEFFVACSDSTTVKPPKFYRQSEDKLTKLQSKRDRRKLGSKARRKLNQKVAKLHQKIARQRKQWHYELANELLDKADVLFVEDLKISNMSRRNKAKQGEDGGFLPNGQSAKSGLNKSFADAGISGFLNEILPYKAAKAGKKVVKVNPQGTSIHCAICLNYVPKELSDRWHSCDCGASMPRDINSGILIKKVGLGCRLTIKRKSSNKKKRRSQLSVA